MHAAKSPFSNLPPLNSKAGFSSTVSLSLMFSQLLTQLPDSPFGPCGPTGPRLPGGPLCIWLSCTSLPEPQDKVTWWLCTGNCPFTQTVNQTIKAETTFAAVSMLLFTNYQQLPAVLIPLCTSTNMEKSDIVFFKTPAFHWLWSFIF